MNKKLSNYNNIINNNDMKPDDMDFEDKDMFLYNKNNDYDYEDFLYEDKAQDLETAKENINLLNNNNLNKVRPAKPAVKTTFKPRTKIVNNSSNTNNIISSHHNNSNVVGNSNFNKVNESKSNRHESNENKISTKESINFGGKN